MSDSPVLSVLTENLSRVQERIASAALRAGRDPAEITLIAVTKYVGVELARLLVQAGCRHLGESRPQELWKKAAALSDLPIEWHMIGHLQRNKLRPTLPLLFMLHSVDRRSLLTAVVQEAEKLERPVPILLEVNVSRDANKHGFEPREVEEVMREFRASPGIVIRGFMAMAGIDHRGPAAQADFRQLRLLSESLKQSGVAQPPASLDVLSMGMSGDLEEAIAEGATMVRVGSALFEGV